MVPTFMSCQMTTVYFLLTHITFYFFINTSEFIMLLQMTLKMSFKFKLTIAVTSRTFKCLLVVVEMSPGFFICNNIKKFELLLLLFLLLLLLF